jgi:hypothetical protein
MGIGKKGKISYAIKVDKVPDNYFDLIFGRQLEYNRIVRNFIDTSKHEYIDCKGKSTLQSVKKWIKEVKPLQFYAKWESDSRYYKDDSVKIYYII